MVRGSAARRCGGRYAISVDDHGIGIPARDLDRIFERFYRVDQGRSRDTGGTGLGLSIVRHVAANHQGRVEVESTRGRGFHIYPVLPLAPDWDTDPTGSRRVAMKPTGPQRAAPRSAASWC